MDEETEKWNWETYRVCWTVLLIEQVSVLCTSVHKTKEGAIIACEEIQKTHPQNRYDIVAVPTREEEIED